ncbi:acyltransferase [Ectobacillus panaciterrae]|uniref:acyltransferase n=1 Tax=Ectobacillus panaciterrae TaxID=363872 RepID=UPI00041441A2|nr:acyltransferase [Ectobacillus panaciterrae]
MNTIVYLIKKKLLKILGDTEKLMKLDLLYYKSLGVEIGNNVRFFSPLITSEPYLLKFGNNITISTNVTFITHDNSVTKIREDSTDVFGEIVVGNNCFIGHGSIILPGVTLGDNVIVGAGSVVTKSFKHGNVIVAGNPAKIICSTEDYEKKISPFLQNTRGMSFEDKKNYILGNTSGKLLRK